MDEKERRLIFVLREYGVALTDIRKIFNYIEFLKFEHKKWLDSLPVTKAVSIEQVRKITNRIAKFFDRRD